MKKRLLSMSGVAMMILYLGIHTVPARADGCDDSYWTCMENCQNDPNCSSYHDCTCRWYVCEGLLCID